MEYDDNRLLEMHGIVKTFPGVRALQNVDFFLNRGEIHALMGENGAGKSTLIKVLTGVYPKDGGTIILDGNPVVIHSPSDAQKLGISTVYQEITLCPNLTVAENMYIGRGKGSLTNWSKMNADANKILEKLDIPAKANMQLILVGYKDPHYFSYLFKKTQGVTPTQYRSMGRSDSAHEDADHGDQEES